MERRDEEVQLKEQRQHLIEDYRAASAVSDAYMAEEKTNEPRGEDKEKLDKIEKEIGVINARLENHTRTESLARWQPEDAIS